MLFRLFAYLFLFVCLFGVTRNFLHISRKHRWHRKNRCDFFLTKAAEKKWKHQTLLLPLLLSVRFKSLSATLCAWTCVCVCFVLYPTFPQRPPFFRLSTNPTCLWLVEYLVLTWIDSLFSKFFLKCFVSATTLRCRIWSRHIDVENKNLSESQVKR